MSSATTTALLLEIASKHFKWDGWPDSEPPIAIRSALQEYAKRYAKELQCAELTAARDELVALRIVLRTQADDLERGNLARTKLTTEVIALRREKAVLVRELRAIDARCPEWHIGNEARAALQPTERGEHGK